MSCFNIETIRKKILAIAISSAISTSIQSSYAIFETVGSGNNSETNHLQITQGAKLNSEIPALDQLLVSTSDFLPEGWISARDLIADAPLTTVNISGNSQSKPAPGTPNTRATLNIQTSADHPLNITSTLPTPQIHRANINDGANPGYVDAVKNIWIHGSDWHSQALLNNPETLTIAYDGVADRIVADGLPPNEQDADRSQSLHIYFTDHAPYERKKAFVVTNLGKTGTDGLPDRRGDLKVLDFSADIPRPPLYFIQHGGHSAEVKGRRDKQDTLALVNGLLDKASGFANVDIGGSDWSRIKLTDPKTINIFDDTEVASILLAGLPSHDLADGKGILVTQFTGEFTNDGGGVTIYSEGHIGNIDLDIPCKRPVFTIEQTGGSLGSIKGLAGKGDSLIATDTRMAGQLSDMDNITFNGSNVYQENQLQSSGLIGINGKIHFLAERTTIAAGSSPASPTFHIQEGATVTIPSELHIAGNYQQNGRLVLTEHDSDSARLQPPIKGATGQVPVVSARTIDIGTDASFAFDSSIIRDPAVGKQYLLMEATETSINQPVNVDAVNELYVHYDAIIDPGNASKMLLTSTHQADHLASQLPHRFHSMMMAAANPTDKTEAENSKPGNASARLTQHVIKNTKKGNTNSKAAELAPSISPHAVHNASLALKSAGKTLDDRMSGKRTGINTGDIFSAGGAWIQYAYSKATQDINDDVPGYHAKTHGFSIGADKPVEDDQDIEVGTAYTWAQGKVAGKDGLRNNIDTDTHIFSLYSSYIEDDFFFDGRMSYSFGKSKGHRYVAGYQHDAKYDTQSWGVGLTGGYTYPLGYGLSWQPLVAFNYYNIKTSDFSESARDPDQTFLSYDQINNGKYDIMELGAGLKLIGNINTGTLAIKPELGLMGYHDFKDDPVAITAHFAAGGESFLINGADRDANRYQFDATVNMTTQNNTTIALSYLHHWADNFKMDGFIARFRYEF